LKTDEKSVFYPVKTTTETRKTHLKEGYESPVKATTKDNVESMARLHKKLVKQHQVQTKGMLVNKGVLGKKRVREEILPKESLPKKRKTVLQTPKKSKNFSIASPSPIAPLSMVTRSQSKQKGLHSHSQIILEPSSFVSSPSSLSQSLPQISLEPLPHLASLSFHTSSISLPQQPSSQLLSTLQPSQPQAPLRKKSLGPKQTRQNADPSKSSKSFLSSRKSVLPLQFPKSSQKVVLQSSKPSKSVSPLSKSRKSVLQSLKAPRKSTLPHPSSKSPRKSTLLQSPIKPSSNKKLQELVERMDIEESSVESMEIEVIQNFWKVDCFEFNSGIIRAAFNNLVF
jgi:hypothetical protein